MLALLLTCALQSDCGTPPLPSEVSILNYDSSKLPTDPDYDETATLFVYPEGTGPLSKGYAPNPRPVFIALRGGNTNLPLSELVFEYAVFGDMVRDGIIFVRPNYPVSTLDTDYNRPVEGVALLIQWLRANRAELNVDPDRIFLYGRSFGGVISYAVSLKEDFRDTSSADPVVHESSRPNYCIAGNAISDLTCLSPTADGLVDELFFPNLLFAEADQAMMLADSPTQWLLKPTQFGRQVGRTPPLYLNYLLDDDDQCGQTTDVHSAIFGHVMRTAFEQFIERTGDADLAAKSTFVDSIGFTGGAAEVFANIHEWVLERLASDYADILLTLDSDQLGPAKSIATGHPTGAPPSPTVTLNATDATPGGTMIFFSGVTQCVVPVQICPGLDGQIFDYLVIGSTPVDPAGVASLTVPVPATPPGAGFLFQAVDSQHCEISNLVGYTIP